LTIFHVANVSYLRRRSTLAVDNVPCGECITFKKEVETSRLAVDNVPYGECITFKKTVVACFGIKFYFAQIDYCFGIELLQQPYTVF
jgi:hypothetical protein